MKLWRIWKKNNMNKKSTDNIYERIVKAFSQLFINDKYLLNVTANERSITHKFAEYLQQEFPDWNVDCEFNRNGLDAKRLSSLVREIKSDDTDGITVYPDIIIHKRGTKENLVVIEAKKSNIQDNDYDFQKLLAYKKDLNYKYAYKIIFPVGKEINKNEKIDFKKYIIEI